MTKGLSGNYIDLNIGTLDEVFVTKYILHYICCYLLATVVLLFLFNFKYIYLKGRRGQLFSQFLSVPLHVKIPSLSPPNCFFHIYFPAKSPPPP